MSSNPMSIRHKRAPSSNSSDSSSTSTSVKSSMSTPPRSSMSLSSRITMSLANHGHSGLSSIPNNNNNNNNANDGDIPFLGTPFAFARERPYEYPFPSPATESCPNLAATSSAMGTMGLGLVHIPPPSALLAQASSSSQSQPPSALPSVLPPVAPNASPTSSNNGPFVARVPLRRRSSYVYGGMTVSSQPPVPPSLSNKARDLNRRTSVSGGRNVTQR